MPSRFSFAAMALAAPLLLTACEREAQQQAEVGQAEEPQSAETEAAAPSAPAEPAQPMAEQQAPPQTPQDAAESEGEAVAVPPDDGAPAGERRTAQAPEGQPATQAPGEPSPEAAGVASVAAYVGRWAEELETCQRSYWTFTNLRLQAPDGETCDILSTAEQEDGVGLEVACTDRDKPLAEPRRGTMSLTFPNLPQTDTMAASGGPMEGEEHTLSRCPLG